MTEKKNQFIRFQQIAFGVAVVAVLGLVGYFFTATTSPVSSGELVEGEHYRLIESPRKPRGTKPEVIEFFSYGCVHCFNFDPELEEWVKANSDKVNFIRTPVVGGDYWRLLGQSYYTLLELNLLEVNHTAMFAEIHRLGRTFRSPEEVADWVDGKGTTSAEFLTAFNSQNVLRRVQFADALARQFQAASVPALVVNGKYMLTASRSVSTTGMLEVAEVLMARDAAKDTASAADPATAAPAVSD